MTVLTMLGLAIYSTWKAINIYQGYLNHKKLTPGLLWESLFGLLMCYWLSLPSTLFLFAKIIDAVFAVLLGAYLNLLTGTESFASTRDKAVKGFWRYTITDLTICIISFGLSMLGMIYG